jgi:excisionase family DNA binding protein
LAEDKAPLSDPWLTLAEIATELRVNPATVRLWVSRGQLKGLRAGQRKWVVRRSELDRMLAENNTPPDRTSSPVAGDPAPASRRPTPAGDERPRGGSVPYSGRVVKARHAAELVRLAQQSLDRAIDESRYAPPAPGYLDRIREIADAFEHTASALRNAATIGLSLSARSRFDWDALSYELKPEGNRPGEPELWEQFDAAVERLTITFTGTDVPVIADGFAELRDALLDVAEELAGDDSDQQEGSAG